MIRSCDLQNISSNPIIKIISGNIQEKFDKKYDKIITKIKIIDLDNELIFIQMKKSNSRYSETFKQTLKRLLMKQQ